MFPQKPASSAAFPALPDDNSTLPKAQAKTLESWRTPPCSGLNHGPKKDVLKSWSPTPLNVTLFGNAVTVDVITLR